MDLSTETLLTLVAVGVTALTIAVTSTETTSVILTNTMNPANLHVRSHFNTFAKVKGNDKTHGFKSVESFVKAHGVGTLTATKEGNNWNFDYAPKAAMASTIKTTNKEVLKDWDAVKKFLEINDIETKTSSTTSETDCKSTDEFKLDLTKTKEFAANLTKKFGKDKADKLFAKEIKKHKNHPFLRKLFASESAKKFLKEKNLTPRKFIDEMTTMEQFLNLVEEMRKENDSFEAEMKDFMSLIIKGLK